MYEKSLQMPFLVRYPPTIPAGSRTDAIVENVDHGPTMLAFAGVETPDYMQGRSFQDICESGEVPAGWKQEAYYRYWMHMAHHDNPAHVGIRTKDFKLIFYYGCNYQARNQTPPGWELYDLRDDPEEVVNQYDNPAYNDVVTDLKTRLMQLRDRVGDTGADYPRWKPSSTNSGTTMRPTARGPSKSHTSICSQSRFDSQSSKVSQAFLSGHGAIEVLLSAGVINAGLRSLVKRCRNSAIRSSEMVTLPIPSPSNT